MSNGTQLSTQPADSAPALARVVLGVTGGIAAYKAAELTRLLVKAGIVVDVVMTDAATQLRHADDVPGAVRAARC